MVLTIIKNQIFIDNVTTRRSILPTNSLSFLLDRSGCKNALNKVNLKLGKVAAKDIEYVESAATEMNKAAHKTADSAAYLNKKTGEILAEGIDMAQVAKHRADAISKVRKNKLGYKNLQDKGSKVESEQCRPDDGL